MSEPARKVQMCGEAEYRDQGEALINAPGDAALIRRGPLRSFLIRCPDGCGETLVVNLDARAGKAWRFHNRGNVPTLYPSVWREGGCGSHFIVWQGRIIWCGSYERGNIEPEYDEALETRLYAITSFTLQRDEDLANQLDEITWDVSRSARRLVLKGLLENGGQGKLNWFRRRV